MLLFTFLYYIFRIFGLTYANYPYPTGTVIQDESITNLIGVLIPCHKSAAEIGETLKVLFFHFLSMLKNFKKPNNLILTEYIYYNLNVINFNLEVMGEFLFLLLYVQKLYGGIPFSLISRFLLQCVCVISLFCRTEFHQVIFGLFN